MGELVFTSGAATARPSPDGPAAVVAPAYARLQRVLADERCVVFDGAVATELSRVVAPRDGLRDESLWGTWALLNAPDGVREVHRRYAAIGCDVLSANPWGLIGGLELERNGRAFRCG